MPEYAPAPMENPHLRALEEETIWWLNEGRLAAQQNLGAMVAHQARFLEELRAALQYEKRSTSAPVIFVSKAEPKG
jgi:hypothetical protein